MAPRAGGSGTDFRMAPSATGSKGRLASGTVCGASVRPGAAASRARVAGAGLRLRMASRCASACNHVCQCVEPIWPSGLPLHRRSWKACSQWYTVVGTASWSSRSAGVRRCRPHPRPRRPGVVLQPDLKKEGVVFALP